MFGCGEMINKVGECWKKLFVEILDNDLVLFVLWMVWEI